MGINGAWKDLKGYNLEKPVEKESLENRRLAIDVNIWLEASVRGTSNAKYNNVEKPYLATIFTRICSLLSCGAKPIIVFDGPDIPPEKSRPFELLDYLGVPYVVSVGEGEAQCAWLEQNGFVDGTVTSDCDYFLFGGETLYLMNFKLTYPETKIVTFSDISQRLEISRIEFIMAAMLSGCDYDCQGVQKIGFKKAKEIIHQFRNSDSAEKPIELLRRFRSHCLDSSDGVIGKKKLSRWQRLNVKFPIDFPSETKLNLYLFPKVQENFSSGHFSFCLPREDKLILFNEEKLKWTKSKTESHFRRISKQQVKREKIMLEKKRELDRLHASKSQLRITDFLKSVKSSTSEVLASSSNGEITICGTKNQKNREVRCMKPIKRRAPTCADTVSVKKIQG